LMNRRFSTLGVSEQPITACSMLTIKRPAGRQGRLSRSVYRQLAKAGMEQNVCVQIGHHHLGAP
jgi:hypothetical protein